MFMAQLPQIPSRQLLRNVSVGSTSFLIRINASSIIGPVLLRSREKDCIFGFSVGLSGFQRYTWKVLILAFGEEVSPAGDVLEGVVGDTVANVRIDEALMRGCDPAKRRDVDVRRVAMS